MATDEELLARVRGGHTGALGELYDRHARELTARAMQILHEPADAADVVHDVLVQVYERAAYYASGRGTVGAWMCTMVRNLALDRARSRLRRRHLESEVLAYEPRAVEAGPELRTIDAHEGAALRGALADLPRAQRETLEGAFFDGLSYVEIAARDGVPLGTVKSRASRAMESLRSMLRP
jgi:RNA polymerase sigma-70 factor (ECF subfamily)